jgi:molybdopterin-guanine dinucleotide biosynthesis protein A
MSAAVAVAILAGGEGRRIGGGKPLRLLGGQRLIDRALAQARQWSDLVAISVRDPAQVEPVDAPLLTDEPGNGGPLAGLVSAMTHPGSNGCPQLLTIAADTPLLPRNLLERLLAEIGESRCALASSGGRLHPVCGLWRTSAVSQVEHYLATGRRSVRGFAELVGYQSVEWRVDAVDPFFNVNSAEELRAAEAML